MKRFTTTRLALCASLVLLSAGSPTLAQSTISAAQCDNVMMVGTQHFAPSVVASCTPYFQQLADGAVARGTFATVTPRAQTAGAVFTNLSASDNGG